MTPVNSGPTPKAERIWRCADCGKWSHAKRNPKTHRRGVFVERGHRAGVARDPIVECVSCGPFEEWRAVRV